MSETSPTQKVTITQNGPYLVTGLPLVRRAPAMSPHGEPLEWEPVGIEGTRIEAGERYALCRCGGSSNKPFCDGTHAKNGFDGTLTADRGTSASRRETMAGDGVVMTDDGTLCADAGFCGTRFTNVWNMIGETGDPEVRERLLRMVANCPSGRLEASFTEGDAAVEPEYAPSIATIADGPLWLRGGIAVEAPDGFAYEARNRQTLCRCGTSQNKPFCDSAHKNAGFTA
jgi:CDGSH-type Zn-finger protein